MSERAAGPTDFARVLAGHARGKVRGLRDARSRRLDWPEQRFGPLSLRPLALADSVDWSESMRANGERMAPWWDAVDDWELASSPRAFADHVLQWERMRLAGTGLALAVLEDGHLVGELQFWHVDPPLRAFEIGVWVRPGVPPRALLGLLVTAISYAFTERGLQRIEAPIAVGNAMPRRLYQLLGFRHEGLLRRARLLHGVPTDHELHALLAEDFAAVEPGLRERLGMAAARPAG